MSVVTGTDGFPPLTTGVATCLVLGSLPSQLSLKHNEYYGNPQNSFWRLMGALFDAGPELTYADRTRRLEQCGVAVWDVLKYSIRPGSMDAAIDMRSAVANDFVEFFHLHEKIELVCFNGQKAARLYVKMVRPRLGDAAGHLQYRTLPSSSPAYAAMDFAAKLKYWSVLKTKSVGKSESR